MAEELKHLLERIQKEGVEEADKKAEEIKERATSEAQKIIDDARAQAQSLVEAAQVEADAHAKRGRQALEQAARDVVLTVGEAVSKLFEGLVKSRVEQSMDESTMRQVLVSVIEAYAQGQGGKLQVLVSPEQQEKLASSLMQELGDAVRRGVTIEGDGRILSGFRVSMPDAHVEHDFTGSAVSGALCELLRPHLAEIVRDALPAGQEEE